MTTLETWESLTPEQMRHILAIEESTAAVDDTSERDWYQIARSGWGPGLDNTSDEDIKKEFNDLHPNLDKESKRLILINCDIIPEPEQ